VKQTECCRRKIVIDQFTGGTSSLVLYIALGISESDIYERNVDSAHFIRWFLQSRNVTFMNIACPFAPSHTVVSSSSDLFYFDAPRCSTWSQGFSLHPNTDGSIIHTFTVIIRFCTFCLTEEVQMCNEDPSSGALYEVKIRCLYFTSTHVCPSICHLVSATKQCVGFRYSLLDLLQKLAEQERVPWISARSQVILYLRAYVNFTHRFHLSWSIQAKFGTEISM
jgi:hypothetical protein